MGTLEGKVAVVAGATRGAGRAIAVTLGAAGAIVYCAGRSVRGQASDLGRPETIEETAELVAARGGTGVPARTDFTAEEQVRALFEWVRTERGRLDVLVNDVWGGEHLIHWGAPFWEHPLADGLLALERGVRAHLLSSYCGAPLMIATGGGLIVEVTDGIGYGYRGNLFYSLAKISSVHLAAALAEELRPHRVAALAVTPGFLRSEQMLDHFGVDENNWRDAIAKDPHFGESETPYLLARGIAAPAADPDVFAKTGASTASWELADEYGLEDADGRRPHWGRYAQRHGFPNAGQ